MLDNSYKYSTPPRDIRANITQHDKIIELSISDNNGNTQTLTFGTAPGATDAYDEEYDQFIETGLALIGKAKMQYMGWEAGVTVSNNVAQ